MYFLSAMLPGCFEAALRCPKKRKKDTEPAFIAAVAAGGIESSQPPVRAIACSCMQLFYPQFCFSIERPLGH